MPKDRLKIDDAEYDLYYLLKRSGNEFGLTPPLWYLQSVMSLPETYEDDYLTRLKCGFYAQLPEDCNQIAKEFNTQNFDGVLACPSEKTFSREIKALLMPFLSTKPSVDLTNHFSKLPGFHAGENETSQDAVYDAITYTGPSNDPKMTHLESVLIIDDIMAGGKTVRAIIKRLFENGLNHQAKITICCPLWICAAAKSSLQKDDSLAE